MCDFVGTLSEVRVHGRAGTIRELRDLAEELARARVRRVGREKAAQAAAVVAVPARDDVHVLAQRRIADGGIVAILALRDGGEVDVVDAPAHERAQPALRHRARTRVTVPVVVDDRGGSGAQQVPRAEP